jgi:glycosyltransferase involved in cell wall biosynthesis/GT2 family glycosyltransferase
MKNISIVIPAWNGKDLLKRFLPSVLKAAASYSPGVQIIVVDDGSTDGTAEFLRSEYPQVEAIRLEKNRGFGRAVNEGVRATKGEIVLLLNNDVMPKEDFLGFLPGYFDKPETFAVRIKSIIMEDTGIDTVESWLGAEFRLGFIYGRNELEYKSKTGFSFTAGGGAMVVSRDKFMQLGGFDDIFLPFYWEDTDLCYRAWKRGWKIFYEPRSILYHYHRSTISKKFSHLYIAFIGERNRYLLIWKNILDKGFVSKHIFFLPLRLLRNIFTGRIALVFAFFAALGRLPMLFERRKIEKRDSRLNDTQVFKIFKGPDDAGVTKVLYLDEWADIHGGGQVYLLNLLKNVDRSKFFPICVCPSRGTLTVALEKIGVRVEIIKMKRLVNPLNIFSFFVSLSAITRLIRREGIKLVHSNAAVKGTLYAGLAARIADVPMVWNVHVLYSAGLRDRFLAALAAKIVVVAEALKVRFKRLKVQGKIIVNHNGVDLAKLSSYDFESSRKAMGLENDIQVVGSIGIFDPVKGQSYLLKAAQPILKDFPKVKFLIVGDDHKPGRGNRLKLEGLAQSLGISENVVFTGWLNNIPQVLAAIDIFVLPSLQDHFPLVVLEAMGSAKPVIATNVGGVPEMVKDGFNGILVPPGDEKYLAGAIISLLKDKARAKDMGVAGRRRAEEFFDIAANAKRIERVYEDLLSLRV